MSKQTGAEAHPPTRNRLLAALSAESYQRVLPHLEFVSLPLGGVVNESGRRFAHVYFPTDGIVSLLHVMRGGDAAEIAMTGNEGLVGISLFLGGLSTSIRSIVQCAGHAFRLPAEFLEREFERGGELQRLLLRFTQALMTQMNQTAVCNRYHTVDQQLCRWLLLSLDRLPGDELVMTQDLIADMLGLRREGVNEAARRLQGAGLIKYRRGVIKVLDRPKLEQRVCECYAVVKLESDRIFKRKLAA